MKALVTSQGRVTIPKRLREEFGIEAGTQVDFIAGIDGIRMRKIVDRTKGLRVLGCLKRELAERTVEEWMAELRGPVTLARPRRKGRRG
jgi:antitoxin PrlF